MQATRSLYYKIKEIVRLNEETSEYFEMKNVISRRNSSSPLQFIIYMNKIPNHARNGHIHQSGILEVRPIFDQPLLYADDIVLIQYSRNTF